MRHTKILTILASIHISCFALGQPEHQLDVAPSSDQTVVDHGNESQSGDTAGSRRAIDALNELEQLDPFNDVELEKGRAILNSLDTPETDNTLALTPADQERLKVFDFMSSNSSNFTSKVPGLDFTIDLKQLDGGEFGADYDARYEIKLRDPENSGGDSFSLLLASKGFLTTDDQISPSSIVNEARISWTPFLSNINIGTYAQQNERRKSFANILDQLDRLNPLEETELEKGKELLREFREFGPYFTGDQAARFLCLDAHVKSEGTQDYSDHQLAIGVGLSTDLAILTGDPSLAKLMDAPFRALRSEGNLFVAHLPRFYFGYDYVTDVDVLARQNLTDDDEYHRLNFQAVWKTNILDNADLRFSWQALYEIDAPTAIKQADKEFASFFEASIGIPMGQGNELILKYTDGELPPTLLQDTQIGVGLRVEF